MTVALLTSSLTSVLGVVNMHRNDLRRTLLWFGVTVLLGAIFLGMEIYEFYEYTHLGHHFTGSAFGSAFYTLVGTHGAHVLFGILWITTLIIQVRKQGIDSGDRSQVVRGQPVLALHRRHLGVHLHRRLSSRKGGVSRGDRFQIHCTGRAEESVGSFP